MRCQFCGCTDDRACAIPYVFDEDDNPLLALPGQIAEVTSPCHWSTPNICSAPACIARAYPEACAIVDRMLMEDLAA